MIYYVGQRIYMENYCRVKGIDPRDQHAIRLVPNLRATKGLRPMPGDTIRIQSGAGLSVANIEAWDELLLRFDIYGVDI